MSVTLMQTALNAGEFSPEVEGRIDLPKYGTGLLTLDNFYPTVQGPIRRRGGTRYVATAKYSDQPIYLASFDFGSDQAYILEFGPLYIRFYANHGVVLSGGLPLEVTTPYTAGDLTTTDGTCPLRFAQSADVMFITHPNYHPKQLQRLSATSFTLSDYLTEGGPFIDVDPANTTLICSSARTGSVTLTTDADAFKATDIGRMVYIEQPRANTTEAWEANKAVVIGDLRRSDGKNYIALNNATTGTIKPTHTFGAQYDGDGGAWWDYQDPGYGWARITAYTDARHVTATVESDIPDASVSLGGTPLSARWSLGEWCSELGFPDQITFFRERSVFARALDQKIWFSVPGEYANFRRKDDSGVVTNGQAISTQIQSDRVNKICWMTPTDILIVGTQGAEYTISEVSISQAFGPNNFKISKRSENGSRYIPAVRVGDSVLFTQRSGRRLRNIQYSSDTASYQSEDLNILANHIIPFGDAVVSMAYQQEPYSVLWVALQSGGLRALTYNMLQQTMAWQRHTIGGSGLVKSVATIPAPNNNRDEVWLAVKRTINGSDVVYIEYVESEFATNGSLATNAFYVDSGLTYSGAPATVITGLSHLEGATVDVLADGAVHPSRVVTAGQITLQLSASVVQVGLSCPCRMQTLHINIDGQGGTGHSALKRVNRLGILFMDTLGGKAGPSETVLDDILFRDPSVPMGSPPPVYNGYKVIPFPGLYDREGHVWYVNSQPLPACIVALQPRVTLTENGS